MTERFQPEESAAIPAVGGAATPVPGVPVPQAGTAKGAGAQRDYDVVFSLGLSQTVMALKAANDFQAVMSAFWVALRKFPQIHTFMVVDKVTNQAICYIPLLDLDKVAKEITPPAPQGAAAAIPVNAVPAGKSFEELKNDVRLRQEGVRR